MSDRLTEIHLPNSTAGIAEYGEHPPEVMIRKLRDWAALLRAEAEAVERAADHEFQIQSYSGVHVQRMRREIQRSTRLRPLGPAAHDTTEPLASPGRTQP